MPRQEQLPLIMARHMAGNVVRLNSPLGVTYCMSCEHGRLEAGDFIRISRSNPVVYGVDGGMEIHAYDETGEPLDILPADWFNAVAAVSSDD